MANRFSLLIAAVCMHTFTSYAAEQAHDTAQSSIETVKSTHFNSAGYRVGHYRSPTPTQLQGAKLLTATQTRDLIATKKQVLLIDVRPAKWSHGQFIDTSIQTLPTATWLANVGHGDLQPQWNKHLRHYVKKQTHNDKSATIIVFCRADCWMSWNVAKRLVSWSYTNVYWFKNGVDGWTDAGWTLDTAAPVPLH